MKKATRLIFAALGLAIFILSTVLVQAQFAYETNNGTITITGYTGPGGAAEIPPIINGLPVTSFGNSAFRQCYTLTNVIICNGVTSIGAYAFDGCYRLISVRIPNTVTSVGGWAFVGCTNLTDITIPDSVTSIGEYAFSGCTGLANVTLGSGVTEIEDHAFSLCLNLSNVYCRCSVPNFGTMVFGGALWLNDVVFITVWDPVTFYYLPGTTGWDGFDTSAIWQPQIQSTGTGLGVASNQFGLNVSWSSRMTVVVEASTTLANPVWSPVSTNTLVDGWSSFSDAEWTNYPTRFYRVRSM